MSAFQAFTGGTYQALAPIFSSDTAINVFMETRSVPGSPKQAVLYGTPGLLRQTNLNTTGNRGWFTQDGRTFTVSGSRLRERLTSTSYADHGEVGNDGFPVSMASNGKGGDQLGVVSAGNLYVLNLNTNALTMVVLPFSGPVMMTFIDGYGLINQKDSPIVWFSNLEDFSIWDALDFFARSGTSDNLVGIAVSRDRVWCFGSKTTTLFYDSGDTDTPFVPYPGTATQYGLVSPWLLGVYADQLVWVSTSAKGDRRVVIASDAQPQPISTPPIDLWLANCTTLADAEMLIYNQTGHTFVCLTAPSSPDAVQTYCFDLVEQMWHARADWDSTQGVYTRWRVRGATVVNGQIIVGDATTGKVYELSLTTYDNDGDVLKRERTTPYLSDDNQVFFVDQIQLGIQAGVGLSTGQGSEPVANLELSRDGGRTFTNVGTGSLGPIGQNAARCLWRRLGRFFQYLCVFRVTQTDPVSCCWTGMWPRITPGSGNY